MNPLHLRHETDQVLAFVTAEAARYLAGLDDAPVLGPHAEAAAASFGGPPEAGSGARTALARERR